MGVSSSSVHSASSAPVKIYNPVKIGNLTVHPMYTGDQTPHFKALQDGSGLPDPNW